MPTYTLSRRLASMDSYTVTDAQAAVILSAKHHAGLGREHWDFQDPQGSTVATLTHERGHLHATYIISRPEHPDLTLTKTNFMPVSETWSLTGGDGTWTLHGDLTDHLWTLCSADGSTVASLQAAWISLHNQYTVSAEDPLPALALAVALDSDSQEHKH